MKRLFGASVILLLSLLLPVGAYGAGSISGSISFSGSQIGVIYVAAFTSPVACTSANPEPYTVIEVPELGSYMLADLPDGSYYLVAVIITDGPNNPPKASDPWGIYNGCDNISPIVINGGNAISGINLTLVDGTNQNPNPFREETIYYHFNVSGNASGFFDIEKQLNERYFAYFTVTGDGGGPYSGVEVIIPFGGHSSPLQYLSPQPGQTWSGSGYTGAFLVNATSTVTSITETVLVAAGSFNNCAKVEETYAYPNGTPPGSYQIKEDRWFCPGIGPAKVVITESDGSQYTGQLTSYQNVTATSNEYFPLGLNYSWTFVMNDGRTSTWVITSETTYKETVFSGHDSNGYWAQLLVEDPNHDAISVNVTGINDLSGSFDLVYDANRGMWISWLSPASNPWFGAMQPPTPLNYYLFKITDSMGPTYRAASIKNIVEVFATNLSPSGGETVTGNPVFSWTGVSGDYTYSVELDDSANKRIWQAHYLRTTSVVYSGPALTDGATYYYNVLVMDNKGNISVVRESFVYGKNGVINYYCDSDGDGHISSTVTDTCAGIGCVPEGCQAIPGDDCNDGVDAVHPGESEICGDGIDNNCDGKTDLADIDCQQYTGVVQLPRTGQTQCYDTAGAEIPCAGTGQDGETLAGVAWPDPRFTNIDSSIPISGNIVLDNLTGLEWVKNGSTPTYTGSMSTCTGSIKTWQGALDYVVCLNTNNYLGHNDWRVPNVNELESLVNAQQANPAAWLNSQGFSNVQSDSYWSSSTSAFNTSGSWIFVMQYGGVEYGNRNRNGYVWPVRSGQCGLLDTSEICLSKTGQTTQYAAGDDGDLQKGVDWPVPRFTDNHNEMVTDNLTRLIWTKDANAPGPAICGPGTTKSWQGALDYVACLNNNNYLGYSKWRLPNRKELLSLIDHSRTYPALITGHPFTSLPNMQRTYWSSSTLAYRTLYTWAVDMGSGHLFIFNKDRNFYVWPVRSGQSGSFGDTDGDGLPTAWEIEHGLDPNDDGTINPDNGPNGNPDNDNSSNIEEFKAGSDPKDPDSRAVNIEIEIHTGLNMFSYPAAKTGGLTSYELLTMLGNSNEIFRILIYDVSAGFYKITYYNGSSPAGDNVSLEFGDGIIIYSKVDKVLSFNPVESPFNSFIECVPINLTAGMNVAAFPCAPTGHSAYKLMSDLGGQAYVSNIIHYNTITGMFESASFRRGNPTGRDFNIMPGEAYFIYLKQAVPTFQFSP